MGQGRRIYDETPRPNSEPPRRGLTGSEERAHAIAELLCNLLEQHTQAETSGPRTDGPLFAGLDIWINDRRFYVTIEEGLP